MAGGLVLGAIGFFLASQVHGEADLYLLVVSNIIYSFGCSPVLLFTTNMIVNSSPSEKAGTAAALSETGNELGGALGIALLGSYGTYLFKNSVLAAISSSLSADFKQIATANLENALQIARTAPGESVSILTGIIQKAYTMEFDSVMLLSSFVLVGLTILVLLKLRHLTLEAEHGND